MQDMLLERLEALTPLINFFLKALLGGLVCLIQLPMHFNEPLKCHPFMSAMPLEVTQRLLGGPMISVSTRSHIVFERRQQRCSLMQDYWVEAQLLSAHS